MDSHQRKLFRKNRELLELGRKASEVLNRDRSELIARDTEILRLKEEVTRLRGRVSDAEESLHVKDQVINHLNAAILMDEKNMMELTLQKEKIRESEQALTSSVNQSTKKIRDLHDKLLEMASENQRLKGSADQSDVKKLRRRLQDSNAEKQELIRKLQEVQSKILVPLGT